jgi:hypothetical protein
MTDGNNGAGRSIVVTTGFIHVHRFRDPLLEPIMVMMMTMPGLVHIQCRCSEAAVTKSPTESFIMGVEKGPWKQNWRDDDESKRRPRPSLIQLAVDRSMRGKRSLRPMMM